MISYKPQISLFVYSKYFTEIRHEQMN